MTEAEAASGPAQTDEAGLEGWAPVYVPGAVGQFWQRAAVRRTVGLAVALGSILGVMVLLLR